VSTSIKRQEWIEGAAKALRVWFRGKGHDVPDDLRVSIGWPKGQHGRGTAIGQCWDNVVSSDKHFEVFISPALKDGVLIFATMAHELVHACVGIKAGHKSAFKEVALAIGLEGKMTATTPGPELVEQAQRFVKDFGPYPAGSLNPLKMKKQSTRLLKCECGECGYVARVTAKWIEDRGAPYCGTVSHGRMAA
jgi:hypothetical protein